VDELQTELSRNFGSSDWNGRARARRAIKGCELQWIDDEFSQESQYHCIVRNYRNVRVWHLAKDLAVDVSSAMSPHACRKVPGIRAQAIRAAVSIAANIAEGCAKPDAELRKYLETSLGSLYELETHLEIALETRILTRMSYAALQAKLDTLRKMLIKFITRLRVNEAS
jgi:four helix bundle protein